MEENGRLFKEIALSAHYDEIRTLLMDLLDRQNSHKNRRPKFALIKNFVRRAKMINMHQRVYSPKTDVTGRRRKLKVTFKCRINNSWENRIYKLMSRNVSICIFMGIKIGHLFLYFKKLRNYWLAAASFIGISSINVGLFTLFGLKTSYFQKGVILRAPTHWAIPPSKIDHN